MQRFRGGLVFKAHRLLYHSTLGLRVVKKKKKTVVVQPGVRSCQDRYTLPSLVRIDTCLSEVLGSQGLGFRV
jgi:hypothetical protein